MKLVERLQKRLKSNHVKELPESTTPALVPNLTEFKITADERASLKKILERYCENDDALETDLNELSQLTAEVKAINNQAALLHGERIKKAQEVLKAYREGAFTSWLIETYGNRQTPYNFLQYHEFLLAMPKALQARIDTMPRQAIYTLASRNAALSDKQAFIEEYQGQTKEELLTEIRRSFPLKESDGRKQDVGEAWIRLLERAHNSLQTQSLKFTPRQKQRIESLLKGVNDLI